MKNFIKKIFAILTLLVLSCILFALVGCSNNNNLSDTNNSTDETSTPPPTPTAIEITSFDGATINEDKIFMFVESNIDSVTLSDKVQVSPNCSWKLYSDKLGRYEIPTKVAASSSGELLDGDNQFYILVSSNTEEKTNFYELTIHRSYEVDINYWFNNEIYKTETAFTGHSLTLAEFNVEDYRLNYWQDEEDNKIDNAIVWDSLNLFANATYLKKTVTLKMNLENAGEISGGGDFYEGETITLTAKPYLGYDFIGWYDNEKLISTDNNAKLAMSDSSKTYVAEFAVKNEMKNFEFESFESVCMVKAIKDKSVSNIIIPDYVTNVWQGIFNGCSNLEILTMPKLDYCFATYFGSTAYENSVEIKYRSGTWYNFYYLPFSLREITVRSGNIPSNAFADFNMVQSISLPNNTTTIGSGAFSNCSNLENLNLPNGITKINDSTFNNCTKITKLNLTESINYIGDYAFSGCENLTEIKIPKNVNHIGHYSFQNCKKIVDLTFPTKLTYVGYAMFRGCENLKSVIVENPANWVYYRLEAGSFTTKQTISEQALSNPIDAALFFITVGNYATTKYFCVET